MPPFYSDERVTVHHGDCLDVLRTLPGCSVDSVVTDPPYELRFMSSAWDGTGIAYRVDLWREALRVLKPGGHMLAFGGSRTWHRLACAIEDAGFEIRDTVASLGGGDSAGLLWMHGQGFPKSKNLDGGLGTALKPAFEPIVVARRPLASTVAANVVTHGTGALNIAATRVGTGEGRASGGGRVVADGWGLTAGGSRPTGGRWPSNVVLSHSPSDPKDGCEPSCPVAELDAQSGNAGAHGPSRGPSAKRHGDVYGVYAERIQGGHGDSGSASRFFPTFRYQAKAPVRERPKVDGVAHPTVKPLALMRWLVRLVTPPGGVVLDPFGGSGATAEAAILEGFRCITIEREAEYLPLVLARIQRQDPPEAPRTAAEQMSLLDDP